MKLRVKEMKNRKLSINIGNPYVQAVILSIIELILVYSFIFFIEKYTAIALFFAFLFIFGFWGYFDIFTFGYTNWILSKESDEKLKELYSKSLENWKKIQSDFRAFDFDASEQFEREHFLFSDLYNQISCGGSFCHDANFDCTVCKINYLICNNLGNEGLFRKVDIEDFDFLDSQIDAMVKALEKELEELK